MKAFELSAKLLPSLKGETVIVFPPLGKLRAETHCAPFLLEITLKNVEIDQLSSSLKELSALPAISYLERELKEKALYFIIRLLLITFACSSLLYILFPHRKGGHRPLRRALLCGLLSILLLALLLGTTLLYTYDSSAFANPRFEGALAAAPWFINLAEEAYDTVKALSEQLGVIALNLEEISKSLDQISPASPGKEIRVLHISDIHNNPAAFDLIEKVTASFQIDLIIDTGDLTDYGSEIETELISKLAGLPLPYLFVPGNHDSPRSIELLRRQGAIILDEEHLSLAGLSIAGVADPSAETLKAALSSKELMIEKSLQAKRRLQEEGALPDILALHNPLMAEPFSGHLPLILCGHTHSARISFEDNGTIIINAGSTGAAGVRGLLAPHKAPYSAVVLYFNPDASESGLRLTAADLITIEQLQDSFTLQRFYNRPSENEMGHQAGVKEDFPEKN